VNPYRRRVLQLVRDLLEPYAPVPTALDFGCGDGWFAHSFQQERFAQAVSAVDVQTRRRCFVQPQMYDGVHLPFADRSFELVYSMDVLHHCPDPGQSLREVLRCSKDLLLIKDHTYSSTTGWMTLCVLDELGNRRFGVPSRYQYQRGWEWLAVIESAGFALQKLVYPAACHPRLLGLATNHLQFIGLWRRAN